MKCILSILSIIFFLGSCQKQTPPKPEPLSGKIEVKKASNKGKNIDSLKIYAVSYKPIEIDFSKDPGLNKFDVDYILNSEKYRAKSALKAEIVNILLLKLYLSHLKDNNQGYDLLSMRKNEAKFVIDYFIETDKITCKEFLNSGIPYENLKSSKTLNSPEIENLLEGIDREVNKY